MSSPSVVVFHGGTSTEREVSLGSGRACAIALARSFPTKLVCIDADALPLDLDPSRHVVFSTLHGGFGEDGGMQRLLDAAGVHYAGCDATASAITIDKNLTKAAVSRGGVTVAKGLAFRAASKPTATQIFDELGDQLVLKPNDQGSSVGLYLIDSRASLEEALTKITDGNWLVEQRIHGREMSVGVLRGRAMGIVEIRPRSGVYDFTSKYTKGATEYLAPAPFDAALTRTIEAAAEAAFAACGCRDYGRVDFILSERGALYFLEINPLPGMKETSLLPMSARCVGLDFTALVREMVSPALERFQQTRASVRP